LTQTKTEVHEEEKKEHHDGLQDEEAENEVN